MTSRFASPNALPETPLNSQATLVHLLSNELASFQSFLTNLNALDESHDKFLAMISTLQPEQIEDKLNAMDLHAYELGAAHTRETEMGRRLHVLESGLLTASNIIALKQIKNDRRPSSES